MKSIRLLLSLLLASAGFIAHAQNYYLIPEKFFLQKGDKLDMHIISTDDFTKQNDVKFQQNNTQSVFMYEGKKKVDLNGVVTGADSVVSYPIKEDGLTLISMITKPAANEMSRSKFLRSLDADDPDNIADKVKNSNQLFYKERYTYYMKTLVQVGEPGGKAFDKPLNEDFEIILKDNPYKFNYGDDISAQINFKGKPLAAATVMLYVKTAGGNVYPQKLSSDNTGMIYFKLSREGVYILSSRHSAQIKDKDADFESWRMSYVFAFSSNNEMPNTYREFGFGNKH
ncbi:DUF4198 domain-containing protein [Mucilaginibacter sp. E4BP6]|uniref:DUF4198 domain-containing protein n=1 Tax=Mucilaginibacter sp. E4BP6 TaxID=2723089 RepID=UPI0015CA2A95|nr:DUF4198 domain-containing protein [Mucilaginibacter sp. E4BP6]NYE68623.1 putative GH25 family protein [Mucilaginibacter sp. E4BP6]